MKSIFNENFVEKEIVSLVNSTWNLLPNLKCASPPKKKKKKKRKVKRRRALPKCNQNVP